MLYWLAFQYNIEERQVFKDYKGGIYLLYNL